MQGKVKMYKMIDLKCEICGKIEERLTNEKSINPKAWCNNCGGNMHRVYAANFTPIFDGKEKGIKV